MWRGLGFVIPFLIVGYVSILIRTLRLCLWVRWHECTHTWEKLYRCFQILNANYLIFQYWQTVSWIIGTNSFVNHWTKAEHEMISNTIAWDLCYMSSQKFSESMFSKFLCNNNLLYELQSTFRSGHSTEIHYYVITTYYTSCNQPWGQDTTEIHSYVITTYYTSCNQPLGQDTLKKYTVM